MNLDPISEKNGVCCSVIDEHWETLEEKVKKVKQERRRELTTIEELGGELKSWKIEF